MYEVTTTEAARLSGLTRQAITSRIKRGLYPSAEKRGRDWFLSYGEVMALVENPPRVGRKRKLCLSDTRGDEEE